MTPRARKTLTALSLVLPALLAGRAITVAGDAAARVSTDARSLAAPGAVPAHMSGSVIDLWYLWALRNALVPAGVRVAVAGDVAIDNVHQESQP
jgi:hypothetical protein